MIEVRLQSSELVTEDSGKKQLTEVRRIKGVSDIMLVGELPMIASAGDPHPFHPGMVANAPQISYVDKSLNVYEVSTLFEGVLGPDDDGSQEEPDVRISISRQPAPLDAWRIPGAGAGLVFPTDDSDPVQGAAGDIGGVARGKDDEPIDHLIYQENIQVSLTLERFTLADELLFESYAGTRNLWRFRMRSPGTVLFTGATTDQARSTTDVPVTLNFVSDAWRHLRQRIFTDPTGSVVKVGADEETSEKQGGTPKIVNWYQPFPVKSDFSRFGVG